MIHSLIAISICQHSIFDTVQINDRDSIYWHIIQRFKSLVPILFSLNTLQVFFLNKEEVSYLFEGDIPRVDYGSAVQTLLVLSFFLICLFSRDPITLPAHIFFVGSLFMFKSIVEVSVSSTTKLPYTTLIIIDS